MIDPAGVIGVDPISGDGCVQGAGFRKTPILGKPQGEVRIDDATLRIFLHGFDLTGQFICKPVVVMIDEADELAFRFTDAPISGHTDPGILLDDETNPGGVTGHDVLGTIRGAIVYHDQFEILKGLIQNAFQGLLDVVCTVVGRNDDGNGGHTHTSRPNRRSPQRTGFPSSQDQERKIR